MVYSIRELMTPKRREYLSAVAASTEPYQPRHGVVANHCLVLGWVETVIRTTDGRIMAWHDIPLGERPGSILGARLTEAGRAALENAA